MEKLEYDLEQIFKDTVDIWKTVKNQNFLITGGTGFFGKWLVSSFEYINDRLSLNNNLFVLTRNPESFLNIYPEFLTLKSTTFLQGDVRKFTFSGNIKLDYIIHAATDADAKLNIEDPLLMFDTIVNGTKYILELAKKHSVKGVLHTSSGAVYGKQPADTFHIKEDYLGSPNIFAADAAYGEAKRVAEMMAVIYEKKFGIESKIARCFTFVGPYLPLDGAFAIGNFIKNVIDKKDICINSAGTSLRSYLYSSDLITWLWTILFNGRSSYPYNVGSDKFLNIKQLAELIASINPQSKLKVAMQHVPGTAVNMYVPSIERAKKELGLSVKVQLLEAINRTQKFYS